VDASCPDCSALAALADFEIVGRGMPKDCLAGANQLAKMQESDRFGRIDVNRVRA
jgi:hypothetical protein